MNRSILDCLLHHLTPAQYRTMPWRNGGGTTTEIYVSPPGVDIAKERFDYRISIADIASNGAFSRFDGYDRHIMLLSGEGMTIDCGSRGTIDLRAPFEPRSFSGDWDVEGALVAGPVRDFNLIVDRAKATSSLEVRLLEAGELFRLDDCTPARPGIVYVLTGAFTNVDERDTLIADAPFTIAARDETRIALARLDFTATPR